jgi:hypothetical protein
MQHFPVLALKFALLAFWAAWFAIVAATNLFGGLKAAGRLPPSWRFASKNFEAVQKAVSVYEAPPGVAAFLFAGVIAWQFAAAALFACAALMTLQAHAVSWPAVYAAFTAGLGLWAAFMLADEITIKYAYEQAHELLFIAQLGTLIVLHLLPS